MANRRELKKLIAQDCECIQFVCLLKSHETKADFAEIMQILNDVSEYQTEAIRRVSHANVGDKKAVKAYFNALWAYVEEKRMDVLKRIDALA
ncbi:MAG: hypothetical protein J6U94_06345 [Paludibacteraceae bacterium]|nr:hypothetical protein [Paludibacteraceae bacterium]